MLSPFNDIAPITMTSREIADLTGKQLSHVNRDIQSMLEEIYPDLDDNDIKGVFISRGYLNGRTVITNISLDREHVDCLLTGYSSVLRLKVVRRLHELEQKESTRLFDSKAEKFNMQMLFNEGCAKNPQSL